MKLYLLRRDTNYQLRALPEILPSPRQGCHRAPFVALSLHGKLTFRSIKTTVKLWWRAANFCRSDPQQKNATEVTRSDTRTRSEDTRTARLFGVPHYKRYTFDAPTSPCTNTACRSAIIAHPPRKASHNATRSLCDQFASLQSVYRRQRYASCLYASSMHIAICTSQYARPACCLILSALAFLVQDPR